MFLKTEELIEYVPKNCKDFDIFNIYVPGEDIQPFLESDIWRFRQVKDTTFSFDSMDFLHQAKQKFSEISSKFMFCLKNEVVNRIRNIPIFDSLNSSLPVNPARLKSVLQERRCRVQEKQENLMAEWPLIVPINSSRFDSQNLSTIPLIYLCLICRYILRNPVQLYCGHRMCQSCAENWKGDIIICPECHEERPKNEIMLDLGFKNDMKTLKIVCSLCDWNDQLKNYQDHLDQCHPNFICEYCSKKFVLANDLNVHKQNECQLIMVPCLLAEYGCSYSGLRGEMSSHYLIQEHQDAIVNGLRSYGFKLSPKCHKAAKDDTDVQLQEVYEKINILAGGIQTLTKDLRRLSNEPFILQNSIDSLKQDCAVLKLSIQEQNVASYSAKLNLEILQHEVVLLKRQMDDIQGASNDGMLIWKITNVKEKMADAQSERETSIYSPIFYSSPTGYKMRARLHLHGDGNARRTHMSLYFVLMRGEYDALLQWPFDFKITFCLHDQTDQQHHIIDSFRPDISSDSFQRPRSEMNIANGIQNFIPLTDIAPENNPYVRHDTMFIKVMVNSDQIPDDLLPFALSLNPGLPTYHKHQIIQTKIDNFYRP